jgi:hypothetical protein
MSCPCYIVPHVVVFSRRWRDKMRNLWLVGMVVVAATVTPTLTMAATNPPSSYVGYIPVAYSSTNGAVRFVRPWGVSGASDPNCLPPSPWALAGVIYDSTLCNIGGSFDAKSGEFYTELSAGFSSDATTAYVNVAYSSSTGSARVVAPWGVSGASDPNCLPPAPWQIPGVSYDTTLCNTGGSFATKKSEYYTEVQSLLHGPATSTVGLSAAGGSANPPPSYVGGFVPLAYDASTGAMGFVRPWGVSGASDPNCLPPSPWALAGVIYDSTLCNIGGSFDAKTSEMYTEFPAL